MIDRVLETEFMDSLEQAVAYDRMDHAAVNQVFVDDLLAWLGPRDGPTAVLDLGTGTAQIPIELCRRDPRLRVVGIDAAASMLEVARENVRRAGLINRIKLRLADAKSMVAEKFPVVMSNSLVHHLPEPRVFFAQASVLCAAGGWIFARDLLRPADAAEWRQLVVTYAGDAEPDQRQMFADSLRAALTLNEVRELVDVAGFDPGGVSQTSDRHWTWTARR